MPKTRAETIQTGRMRNVFLVDSARSSNLLVSLQVLFATPSIPASLVIMMRDADDGWHWLT